MSEWWTTKKRGRDDAQIQRDSELARAARRQKNQQIHRKPAVPKKAKIYQRLSVHKLDSLAKKQDMEDDDNWIVKSDEEEEEISWNGDDKDEEELLEESDHSSSSENGTSVPSRHRPKKPSQVHKKKKFKEIARKRQNKLKVSSETIELSSSDGDDDDDLLASTWTLSKHDNPKPPTKILEIDDDDDNSSYESQAILFDDSHAFQTKEKDAISNGGGIKDDKNQQGNDSDDLTDTPREKAAIRKKPKKFKQATAASTFHQKHSAKQTPSSVLFQLDDDSDMDSVEKANLEWALKQSVQTQTKNFSKKVSTSDAAEDIPDSDRDDDDDDDDQDDEQDEYVDENARAASNILDTANQLSAQVLQTMAQWSNSAVSGMIVDGALALTQLHSGHDIRTTDHTWISQNHMQEILPEVVLAEYQLIGVNWLALLHSMKCGIIEGKTKSQMNVNGILADEMGLGKTVQTIAFLAWLKRHEQTDEEAYRPHLIVAPASVISNWKREFETFAPDLHVVKYHGTLEERQSMQQELQRCKGNVDVVLASVSYMQKENSEDRSFLRKFRYNYLVVDEGHLLKNPRSNFYKNIDRFSTLHRLLLTGTPVQNSPKELMSLLCFLMPLFSQKSKDEFDTSNGHDGGESMLQHFVSMQGTGTDDVAAYKKLKQLFSPFVLRRRKQDVLSQIMPPKERRVEFVDLDSTARAIYNSIIADHVKSRKSGTGVDTHLFTQLRKAAHHPLMLRNRFTSPEEKERLAHWFYRYGAFRGDGCTKAKVEEELEKFTDFDIHLMALELIDENEHRRNDLEKYVLDEEDLFRSAKFVSLRTLLPDLIADGHRILIFSVWTTCLDLLGCLLESLDIAHLRMDGSTAVGDRQSLIDKFNRDSSIPVFLLSTKACGLGINLTSADTCIMHDLDFNPFNDLQAEDRCHRIGQKKPVTVIKLVSKDTVDEDIYNMQQRKAKMNAAIMESDSEWNKIAKKEKDDMLKHVMDRYLRSPEVKDSQRSGSEEKENFDNTCDSI